MDTKQDNYTAIRKGLLEFLVLAIVSKKKAYAAEILERLGETDFKTQEGTLYPLLSKMRRDQSVDYEWIESELGPPRKYYGLTDKGRRQLEAFEKYWKEITSTINQLQK